jgi:hypothetical protein
MKIAMACALLSPPVFYILETMWTVAFRVLGLILAATMFSLLAAHNIKRQLVSAPLRDQSQQHATG